MRQKTADRAAFALAAFVLPAVLLASPARAEMPDPPPVTIPPLSASAATVEAFAPKGWIVEAKASGDLDGDGTADLAFVLHGTDKANILDNEDGLGDKRLDTNPRILGVALAQSGGGYRLVVQNATLIPRRDSPTIDDFFNAKDGLTIARGAVRVVLSLFASAGGWSTSQIAYTFKLAGSDLQLIGYDRSDIQRNSGETLTISINYVSGRMSRETGTISDDATKKTWGRAPAKKPTIESIGDGIEFQPVPN